MNSKSMPSGTWQKSLSSLLLLAILLPGCEPGENESADFRIDRIDNVGRFHYEGGRLIRLGDESLGYGPDGSLSTSRIFYATDTLVEYNSIWGGYYDSTFEYRLEKYTYSRVDPGTLMRITDTFIHKVFQSSRIPFPDIRSFDADTSYFWFNQDGTLDSIVLSGDYSSEINWWMPVKSGREGTGPLKTRVSTAYSYDLRRNITSVRNYQAGLLINRSEYSYDDHPNPYQRIFRLTGTLLRSTAGTNFSVNNPVSILLTDYHQSEFPVQKSSAIRYDYNPRGLPVTIYYETDTVRISYK